MTRTRHSIRYRIISGLAVFTLLLSLIVAGHGYWVNEQAEARVWQSMLETELSFFKERRQSDPSYRPGSDAIRLYLASDALPGALQSLSEGLHDEVEDGKREYVVLVEGSGAARMVLALDITEQEGQEIVLAGWLALSVLAVAILLSAALYWWTGSLVRPMTALSEKIKDLPPDATNTPIKACDGDPQEVVVIHDAINDYTLRIQQFMERERTFINLASHELRSPVAVVRSSMEVALARADVSEGLRPHLARAHRTARDMEDLSEMLLALARDPGRTPRIFQEVQVAQAIPRLVEEYAAWALEKDLSLSVESLEQVSISAPPAVLRAIIGNLIRNAIENSDRGDVKVRLEPNGLLTVEDSGHGMSPEEMAALHSRIVRGGFTGSAGIGLGLISRLCTHFGWELHIQSQPEKGTKATVHFRRSDAALT